MPEGAVRIPWVVQLPCSRPGPGGRSIHVSLIALSRDTLHPQALRTSVGVRADADTVVLTFLDGTEVEV
ncbi:hypothetical protein [Streptomyces sp. LN590]|uniref:hypothetical protein n=1 Tax=unclassified Streptomyces TaxID=2593676 RepID=UPI00371AA4B6